MKEVPINTIRVTPKLQFFKKTTRSWRKIPPLKDIKQQLKKTIQLYKSHNNFTILKDTKNPKFLKGFLLPNNQASGARIPILPNNQRLDKAFSLFASHLHLHDQDSHDHWDVLYQNKGGTWSYCYSLEKKQLHQQRKYKKVQEFAKLYNKLTTTVQRSLRKKDHLALPMYTLLKTYMRIGNEVYYKAHNHKGLTTLKKQDITIKNNTVTFNYLAKDGVPRTIQQEFPKTYIQKLKTILRKKKANDFVFTNCKTNHPLRESEFKKAFKHYCGKEFYPHIVRSHYATSEVQKFLKAHRKPTKEQVQQLYLDIAAHLGHKKFLKKENRWKNNYTVTINHYIQPQLIEKIKQRIQ